MPLTKLLFSTDGRISRSTYWYFCMVYYVMFTGVSILEGLLGLRSDGGPSFLFWGFIVLILFPSYAVSVKRAHDRGHSGWWLILISLIPLLGVLWVWIELGFLPGSAGRNFYGADPTEPLPRPEGSRQGLRVQGEELEPINLNALSVSPGKPEGDSKPPLSIWGKERAPHLAAFSQRAIAYMADAVILGFVGRGISFLMSALNLPPALNWIAMAAGATIGTLYFLWPYSHGGQTLGKKIIGIRVMALDGPKLGWRHGILRTLGLNVSQLSLGLGFLWSIKDRERQTWHDKIAGTCVVGDGPFEPALEPSMDAAGVHARQWRWILGTGAPLLALTACTTLFVLGSRLLSPQLQEMQAQWVDADYVRMLAALSERCAPDDLLTECSVSRREYSSKDGPAGDWLLLEIGYAGTCTAAQADPCEVLADELTRLVIENYAAVNDIAGLEVTVTTEQPAQFLTTYTTWVDKSLTIPEWRKELHLVATQPG